MDDSTLDHDCASVGVTITQDSGRPGEAENEGHGLEVPSLLEALGVAMVVTDGSQRIQAWNPAAGALFGGTAAMHIGLSLQRLAGPQDEGRFEAALQAASGRGEGTVLRRFALHPVGPGATYADACVAPLLTRKGAQKGTLFAAVAAQRDPAPPAAMQGGAFTALMHELTNQPDSGGREQFVACALRLVANEAGRVFGLASGITDPARDVRIPETDLDVLAPALDTALAALARIDSILASHSEPTAPHFGCEAELDTLVRGAVERLVPILAAVAVVEVDLATAGLRARADSQDVGRVVRELLLEAGQSIALAAGGASPDRGWIRVRTRAEGDSVRLEVQRSGKGPGIDGPRSATASFVVPGTRAPAQGLGLVRDLVESCADGETRVEGVGGEGMCMQAVWPADVATRRQGKADAPTG